MRLLLPTLALVNVFGWTEPGGSYFFDYSGFRRCIKGQGPLGIFVLGQSK